MVGVGVNEGLSVGVSRGGGVSVGVAVAVQVGLTVGQPMVGVAVVMTNRVGSSAACTDGGSDGRNAITTITAIKINVKIKNAAATAL